MNEIKKSLLEVAGDMSENKNRIRRKLYEHQNRKTDLKRNVWAGIVAFAMIAIMFVVTSLLMKEQQQITQGTPFDDKQFEFAIIVDQMFGFDMSDETRQEFVFDEYERDLAIYAYALSLGYEITEAEIEERYQKQISMMFGNEDVKQTYLEKFAEVNITQAEYEEYLYKLLPSRVALDKLRTHYMDLYPKISSSVAGSLAVKNAVPYFREQYSEDINVFKEKHGLPLHEYPMLEGSKIVGRIVTFEDNMFLLVPNATIDHINTLQPDEIVDQYLEAYWFPLDQVPELNVGDLVEAYSSTRESPRSPFVSDLTDLKMLDDYDPDMSTVHTEMLTIPSENYSRLKSFVNILRWDEMNFDLSRSADYEFEVEAITYEVWVLADGFVVTTSNGMYKKLSEDFTNELKGYLGLQ
nr:hypothetical protein [Lysinibacillus timonensis]